jgi:hypothetical protein
VLFEVRILIFRIVGVEKNVVEIRKSYNLLQLLQAGQRQLELEVQRPGSCQSSATITQTIFLDSRTYVSMMEQCQNNRRIKLARPDCSSAGLLCLVVSQGSTR